MEILVTGGAGYIGSHTVRLLSEAGHRVTVFDNLESGHREAIDLSRVKLAVGDLRNPADLEKLTAAAQKPFDACIHFAGYIVSPESVRDPDKYFRNNCFGSLNLFNALVRAGTKAVVFSSSCAVYGTTRDLPLKETHPENPESPYAESKRLTEILLGWFYRCHGVSSISLRYFNASGAAMDGKIGQDFSPPSHLIPIAIQAALGQRPHVCVYGTDFETRDGTCIRDYIHVEDLAAAHLKAIEKLAAGFSGCAHYNCGVGVGYTVREVLETIKKVSGRNFTVQDGPRRAGDPTALYADNSLIRKELSWSPKYNLEQIVESAWRWHSSHPDGYRG